MENGSTKVGTIAGALLAAVTATVNLAIVFGVHLTEKQATAIVAEATALIVIAPLVGALIDHSRRQANARANAAYIAKGNP